MKINKWFKNLKLKPKIILLFVLSVMIPVTIMTQFIIQESTRNIIEKTVTIEEDSVMLVSTSITNLFSLNAEFCNRLCVADTKLKEVLSLNRQYRVVDNVELYSNYLNAYEMDALYTDVDFTIYFFQGSILQNYTTFKYIDGNVKSLMEYQDAIADPGQLVWGYNEKSDKVYMSRTIEDRRSNILGVVVVRIDCTELELMMGSDMSGDRLIALSNADGKTLIADIGLKESAIHFEQIISLSDEGKNIFDYSANGMQYKVISKNIADDTDMPRWKIIEIIPINNILYSANVMRNRWFLITACIMLASCMLFIIVIQFVTKSISILMNSMQEVGSGKFLYVEEPPANDEIASITRSYNQMVRELKMLIKDNYEKNLRLSDALVKKQQAELNALQSQIHPHFLFNTLGSVVMKIRNHNAEEAERMLLILSKLLRKSINWSGEMITLGEELDFIINYLDIQKMRFKDRMSYSVYYSEELRDVEIPKLIIQPLVENSVIHGIENKIGAGHINVRAYSQKGMFIIEIKDDGIGIDPEKLQSIQKMLSHTTPISSSEHVGLYNVHSRMHERYGSNYNLHIVSERDRGTSITLRMPERRKNSATSFNS